MFQFSKKIYQQIGPDKNPILIGYLTVFFSILQPLILAPLVIANYSSGEAAVWLFVGTLMSVGALFDAGVSATALRICSYFMAGNQVIPRKIVIGMNADAENLKSNRYPNWRGVNRAYTTLKLINSIAISITVVLVLLIGVIASWSIPSDEVFDRIILGIALATVVGTTYRVTFLGSVLQAVGQLGFFKKIELFSYLLRLTGLLMILKMDGSFLQLFIWWALCNFVTIPFLSKRIQLKKCWDGSYKIWLLTKPIIKNTFAANVGAFFCVWGTSVIAMSIQSDQAVQYLFFQRVFVSAMMAAILLMKLNQHNIAQKAISDSLDTFKKTIIYTMFGCSFLFILILSCFFVFLSFAAQLFSLSLPSLETALLSAFFISYFLELLHTIAASFVISLNRNPFVLISYASGFSIIISSYFIGPIYGAIGLIMCQLLCQLATSNWYAFYRLNLLMRESNS